MVGVSPRCVHVGILDNALAPAGVEPFHQDSSGEHRVVEPLSVALQVQISAGKGYSDDAGVVAVHAVLVAGGFQVQFCKINWLN